MEMDRKDSTPMIIKSKNHKQKVFIWFGSMILSCCVNACSFPQKPSKPAPDSQATEAQSGSLGETSKTTETTEITKLSETTETAETMEPVFESSKGIPMAAGNDLLHKVSRSCPPEWNGVSYYQAFQQFFVNRLWQTENDSYGNTVIVFTGDCKFQQAQSSISIRFIADIEKNTVLPYELMVNDKGQNQILLHQLMETAFQAYDTQKDDPLEEARSLYLPVLNAYRKIAEKGSLVNAEITSPCLIWKLDEEYFLPSDQLAKHPIFYTLQDIAFDSEPELLISQYVIRNDDAFYSLADIWTIRNGKALRVCPTEDEVWFASNIQLYQGGLISCQYFAGTSRSGYQVFYMDPYTWSLQKKDSFSWNAFADRGRMEIPMEEIDFILQYYDDIEVNLSEFDWTKLADIK